MSRHESPDVGDAIVRLLRGLVTRAQDGDTEALEQLARIERLAPVATSLGLVVAHDFAEHYSWTFLGDALGTSRQAARQRAEKVDRSAVVQHAEQHQLVPGHAKATCRVCRPNAGACEKVQP